jgi:hypothetical protein
MILLFRFVSSTRESVDDSALRGQLRFLIALMAPRFDRPAVVKVQSRASIQIEAV